MHATMQAINLKYANVITIHAFHSEAGSESGWHSEPGLSGRDASAFFPRASLESLGILMRSAGELAETGGSAEEYMVSCAY